MPDIATSIANYPDFSPTFQKHLTCLLDDWRVSGQASPNLKCEIAKRDEQKLWACVWEAMLYRHFSARCFKFWSDHVGGAGQNGPDLGLIHESRTVWIEAVVPKPEGIPRERLVPPPPGNRRASRIPYDEMLLRCTSALVDKNRQLQKRLDKNVVGYGEPYVVAINSCMLSWARIPDHSNTWLPWAVRAVYPVGRPAVPLSKDGQSAGETINVPYDLIKKSSGAVVPTNYFLDPEYAGISALMGCSQRGMLEGRLELTIVHNALARNPLPTGVLGARAEWVAQEDGGGSYTLTDIGQARGHSRT